MARRTVCTMASTDNPQVWCRVQRDSELNEYRVVFYHQAKRLPDTTDYHTDSLDDAKGTAKKILEVLEQRVENGMKPAAFKCFKCGLSGHFAAACLGRTVEHADRIANTVDAYIPKYGLGQSRASIWRGANNKTFGADLDHEID